MLTDVCILVTGLAVISVDYGGFSVGLQVVGGLGIPRLIHFSRLDPLPPQHRNVCNPSTRTILGTYQPGRITRDDWKNLGFDVY